MEASPESTPKRLSTRAVLVIVAIVLVIVAFVLGYVARGPGETTEPSNDHEASGDDETAPKVEIWTCAMHPHVRQPKPGKCPDCGMDLILATSGESDEGLGPRQIRLSEHAQYLADIQHEPVTRRFVSARIRMVGKVDYDETRLRTITAWVPGRLDRLYVDYTGIPVAKGDHLVYLYSPELRTAQQEFLQSLKRLEERRQSGTPEAVADARQMLDAVRVKLRLWGLSDEQIDEIGKRGTPSDHMTINAPMSGIVIHKNAVEGIYVKTGTPIYTIADLSRVWVKLDAYESDLLWIKYAQPVEFEVEAYPGETFEGTIAFIDPVLDARTRTVKVRVNVENPDGKLKPGMFIRAVVRARVAAGGRIVNPDVAGKWISPMHPEIIKDEPGTCDVCGMPLVSAETLGYVSPEDAEAEAPLVIPASAPLITGRRAVVYVAVPDKPGVFEGREIVLGPRAGDYYLVMSGLDQGESVVTNGNFKIDSAAQIQAKPSMMQPEGGAPPGHHHGGPPTKRELPGDTEKHQPKRFDAPDEFKAQLNAVYSAYFAVQQALSQDNVEKAKADSQELLKALDTVDMKLLEGPAHNGWMKHLKALKKTADGIAAPKDITDARATFQALSGAVYALARQFGDSGSQPILRFHCPMAFGDSGADWLQNKPGTENPYFGSQMFTCGDHVETVSPGPVNDPGEHDHE